MAAFISALLFSFSSKAELALVSASATYLLRASSCWSRTFISSLICLSTRACLTFYSAANLSATLVLFKCSRASLFLAYSSILFSSSFSLRATSAWILISSSFAFLNSSHWFLALSLLASSFSFSSSSSWSTYFLISWPSSSSSYNLLM